MGKHGAGHLASLFVKRPLAALPSASWQKSFIKTNLLRLD
jgi:hypothetical protein